MTHFHLFRTLATGAAMMGKSLLTGAALLCAATTLQAQNSADGKQDNAPANMLNIGLDRHDFFYSGESKTRYAYKIKGGKKVWEFTDPEASGEISDAVMMSDGNVLIAHQHGLKEITADKKVVWSMDAPKGTEIHTAKPIGLNHVVYVQNGDPLKVIVMEVPSMKKIREFEMPYLKPAQVHGQIRNCCLTKSGTLLVAHMQMKRLLEYDSHGRLLNEWAMPSSPWGVSELDNVNILVTCQRLVVEMNRKGETVWEFKLEKSGRYAVGYTQKSYRLKNGNTVITIWYNEWNGTVDKNNPPVQCIEVTPDKRIVWELCSWSEPMNLGPATTFVPLDEPVDRCKLFFGDIKPTEKEALLDEWNGTRKPKQHVGPNEPLGEGIGVKPGRVAWVHCPGVAKWDGETGLWVEDRWNSQEKADRMVRQAVVSLTGEKAAGKAWKALFRNFNMRHGKGSRGYQAGEKIAVKLNMNNVLTHRDTIELNSSPFVTLALVRSMVNDGKVRQEDITICEPSRTIPDSIFDKCHREFPRVHFVDNIGGEGREKCTYYPDRILYSVDNGKMARGIAKCVADADYLINSALLKTHVGPGVTLTAKNWYGATDIDINWHKNAHNHVSADKRNGKPEYKTFVDWMGHKDLGGKALLYIIDGTYGSRNVNGKPAPKWQKPPFCNDWCCSLLASQDGVAVDAVGMDMIIGEWPEYGSLNYCDEYLEEAATIPNPATGTVYDPERDGKPLTRPLGLFEHWNNPVEKKYTKLDLVYKKIE